MEVQYLFPITLVQPTGNNRLGLGGIFDGFKVKTDSYNDTINRFRQIDFSQRFLTQSNDIDWNSLSTSIGPIDDRLRSYFQTLNDGNGTINNSSASLEDFSNHLRRTGQAYDFTALKATALNTAINAGVFVLAGIVITALSSAWDTINVTVAETQEKINEITSSLAELNSEYDALSARDIDSLSQSEKERLEYLEDRIAKEEELLKIQEAKKAEEEIGGGFTDYFDKDSYTRKLSDEKFGDAGMALFDLFKGGSSDNITLLSANTLRRLKDYKNLQEDMDSLQEQRDSHPKNSILYNSNQESINKLQDKEDDYISDMQEQLLTWKGKRLDYETAVDDLKSKISNPNISNNAREQAKEYLAEYEDMLQTANTCIERLEDVLHSPQSVLESLDERLTNFSAEDLENLFTEDELNILYQASFDPDATESALREIIAGSQETAEEEPISLPFSFEDRMTKVQDLSGGFDLLSDIYSNISDGDAFDWSSLLNNEEFKEIFGEFGSIYDDFMQTVSNAPDDIGACQSAFDRLSAAYLSNSDALRYVTADTKDATVSMLEQMGISNALEIVTNSLALNEQTLADSKSTVAQMAQTLAQASASEAMEKEAARIGSFDFQNATLEEINALIAEANQLGIDSGALVNFKLAKFDVSRQSLNLMEDVSSLLAMAKAANISSQAVVSLANAQAGYNAAKKSNDEFAMRYWAAQMDSQRKLVESQITNFQIPTVKVSPYQKQPSGNLTPSAAAPAETKETFNFIETAINRISSAIDKLKSKAEETFSSFTSRGRSYSEAIKKIGEELSIQEQAMQKYAANRDNVGLDESWASQVRDGSLNIAEVSDSSLKEKIQEYQKWNDMVNECSDSISDLKKEQDELIRDKLELLITKYEKLSTKTAGANERIQNKIDLKESWGGLASTKGYIKMNKNLSKQVGYARSQNSELRQLQKTVTKGSEAWHEYQEQIDKNNASMQDLTKSMVENAKAAAALAKEKANAKVEKYDSKDELYDAKIENAATSKAKNDLIDQKIDNIDNRQTAYDSAYNTSSNKLKSASDSISKMKKKSTKTKNAATNKANQTYNDVLAKVKARVKAGEKIPVVLLEKARKLKDNAKLYNACVQYNAYFDAKAENKEIADIYRETSQQDRAELTLEKFNNTAESYDNSLRSGKQQASVINNRISLANEQGKTASASDYKELSVIEEKNQKTLIDKRNALQNALDDAVKNGSVKENSEEWYEMKDAIDAVTNEIDESTRSIVEYQNAIRQLEWDKFDKGMESLKRDNSERDYQIDMLSHKKLVDDETGDFTDEGKTTLNLRKSNYQNYLTQAAKYQKEYQNLQSQIAKGELDADDEKVVARLRELEDAHHNVMLSAEDEKESIASLIKEGYDAQLNSLSKLIQKYKDLRQNAKDAYEYQKSISEKTKNIASLQKQLAAYGSNDTEEARAKIQQLKVDLENAKQDLKDTEYEKYLSDTNDMLDELYSDYEAFIDKKLEDTDTLLENIDSSITNMSDSVSTVLSSINQTTEDLIKALTASPSPQTQDIYPMGMIPPAVPNPISDMVLPKLDLNNSGYGNAVTISMGDIVLQDVQNPEQFSRQLVTAIADNPRVQRSIQSVSVERLVKSNGLSVNRYK